MSKTNIESQIMLKSMKMFIKIRFWSSKSWMFQGFVKGDELVGENDKIVRIMAIEHQVEQLNVLEAKNYKNLMKFIQNHAKNVFFIGSFWFCRAVDRQWRDSSGRRDRK